MTELHEIRAKQSKLKKENFAKFFEEISKDMSFENVDDIFVIAMKSNSYAHFYMTDGDTGDFEWAGILEFAKQYILGIAESDE